jgi:hypothetical protein
MELTEKPKLNITNSIEDLIHNYIKKNLRISTSRLPNQPAIVTEVYIGDERISKSVTSIR